MSASRDAFSPAASWQTETDDDEMDFEVRERQPDSEG